MHDKLTVFIIYIFDMKIYRCNNICWRFGW